MKRLFVGLLASGMLCLMQTSVARASGEAVLYSFCHESNCTDGASPLAGLIAVDGILYGTTQGGGSGNGTIFSFDPNTGTLATLYSFAGQADGSSPEAPLTSGNGRLYGTTYSGGISGDGTVFTIDATGSSFRTLHSFAGAEDGASPRQALLFRKGILYGVTDAGGTTKYCSSCGTVFSVKASSGHEQVLYSSCSQKDCTDGSNPAGLLFTNDLLYGTAVLGGHASNGTVFSLDPASRAEATIYTFRGDKTGDSPLGALISRKSLLYGTTGYGGSRCSGCGTVFSLDPSSGTETVIYSFDGGSDGSQPQGALLKGKTEYYGTTYIGGGSGCGGHGCGTVFGVNVKDGTEEVVHAFVGGAGDGGTPNGTLVEMNGTLYGTTWVGGGFGCGGEGCGTIFSVTR